MHIGIAAFLFLQFQVGLGVLYQTGFTATLEMMHLLVYCEGVDVWNQFRLPCHIDSVTL